MPLLYHYYEEKNGGEIFIFLLNQDNKTSVASFLYPTYVENPTYPKFHSVGLVCKLLLG
jgi:hypothetical protein